MVISLPTGRAPGLASHRSHDSYNPGKKNGQKSDVLCPG